MAVVREQRRWEIARQFTAFTAVGAFGTGAHYLTLIICVTLGMNAVLASALGATAGAIVNYLLNYHLTFGARSAHRYSAPRFAVIAAGSLILNTCIMAFAVRVVGLHYLLAQVAATAIVLLTNFLASRFWAFSSAARARTAERR